MKGKYQERERAVGWGSLGLDPTWLLLAAVGVSDIAVPECSKCYVVGVCDTLMHTQNIKCPFKDINPRQGMVDLKISMDHGAITNSKWALYTEVKVYY